MGNLLPHDRLTPIRDVDIILTPLGSRLILVSGVLSSVHLLTQYSTATGYKFGSKCQVSATIYVSPYTIYLNYPTGVYLGKW